jgi:ubiquinone/menaquinone biosynthesis C-methylase UbiE/ADP-ribose pyrophosphatase YjhB (NUDIX family)
MITMTARPHTMNEGEIRKLFEEVYGTVQQRTAGLIGKYAALYSLPHLKNEWAVDAAFFQHCQKTVNFVVIALYDKNGAFFTIYSHSMVGPDEPIGWKLPGGPILDSRNEFIEEAVHRIVTNETNLRIDELRPIALVTNTFQWNGGKITHVGLAFMGRCRGTPKMTGDIDVMLAGTGLEHRQNKAAVSKPNEALFQESPPEKMAFSNREIFIIAKELLASLYLSPTSELPIGEIDGPRRLGIRLARFIHRTLISKVIYVLASRQLKRRVLSKLGQPSSVLDASAGDDTMVCQIAKNISVELCVANDISWREMERARNKARRRHLHVLFTNHHLSDLPFKTKFDVVILKNTLHHARTGDEALAWMESLKRIGKRLIVVDIEDPQKRLHAKVFNWYYTKIHGDQGHNFYSEDQFHRLMKLIYPDAEIAFDRVGTVKGLYMFASLSFAKDEAAALGV